MSTSREALSREAAASLDAQRDLEILIESARDYAILTLDADGLILSWSPGAEQVTGFTAADTLGRHVSLLFTPEDRAAGVPQWEMAEADRTGRAPDERWQLRKDGSRYFASGVMLANRGERPYRFAKVFRDATRRRCVEEERDRLLASERHARAEAERSIEEYRRLQLVTDIALDHLGVDELLEELLLRIQGALHVDAAAVLLLEGDELVVRAARGLEAEVEQGVRVPLGAGFAGRIAAEGRPLLVEDLRSFPVHSQILRESGIRSLSGVPLRVGEEILGVLHVGCFQPGPISPEAVHLLELVAERAARGIERARLYEEGERRLDRLHLLSEAANGLLLSDEPHQFLDRLFPRLAAHLGVELYLHYAVAEQGDALELEAHRGLPEEMVSRLKRLRFGEAVCGTVARSRKASVLSGLRSDLRPETELMRDLGLTAYACHPLIAAERLIGTLSFGTSRKPAFTPEDLELLGTVCDQVAAALERVRLSQELERRALALEEADRRKDEFLATLAHELRNPLAGIANATYVLDQIPVADEQRPRLRGVIRRQTEHLSRMVDDLLDLSRITHGKIELRREPVDFAAVIRQAIETTRPFIQTRLHELSGTLPAEPIWVLGDPTRLEQVVNNLLNNAAKYTDPGGHISLAVTRDDAQVVLRVRDNGIGIAPELLPHIFELFIQAEQKLDRAPGGLGIGLTLVHRLVELHGGTVRAFSQGIGAGSEFVVRLPLLPDQHPPQAAGAAEAESRAPESHAALRVLVVEDNPDAAETLAEILTLWNVAVRVVRDGPSAVAAAEELPFDLVLLDIGLPGIDGYEVARRLRRLPGMHRTRLVALTGYGQAEDRRQSQEAGIDLHLVKPVDPERLRRTLFPSET
ncbi:MAG: GAF domain-containing protein [Armatimonadota bacterium]